MGFFYLVSTSPPLAVRFWFWCRQFLDENVHCGKCFIFHDVHSDIVDRQEFSTLAECGIFRWLSIIERLQFKKCPSVCLLCLFSFGLNFFNYAFESVMAWGGGDGDKNVSILRKSLSCWFLCRSTLPHIICVNMWGSVNSVNLFNLYKNYIQKLCIHTKTEKWANFFGSNIAFCIIVCIE